MNSEYVYCPECKTRNFTTDEVCGVCKAKLPSSHKPKSNSKANFLPLVILALLIVAFYYIFIKDENVSNSDLNANYLESSLVQYEIIKVSVNAPIKCVASVRINEKYTITQLQAIAKDVKKELRPKSERIHLFFLLPEMKDENGTWATADFQPTLKIQVLGLSIEDENIIRANLPFLNGYEGLWIDNYMKGAILQAIRKDKKLGLVRESVSATDPKPSEFPTPLKQVKIDGKTVYKDLDHTDQYYVLEANGDLSVYDRWGYIQTYVRMK